MILDIIGSGPSAALYNWESKNSKWSVASASDTYKDLIDLYFCMHDDEKCEYDNINQKTYPLEKIIDLTGTRYFCNSITYMLAYAIYKGVEVINIYGVDIENNTEYAFERPSVAYWIGYCRASGIEVNNITELTEPIFDYGYDTKKQQKALNKLERRKEIYKKLSSNSTGDTKQQYIGAMFCAQKIIDELKG